MYLVDGLQTFLVPWNPAILSVQLRENDLVPRRQESLKTIDKMHYEAQLKERKEDSIRTTRYKPHSGIHAAAAEVLKYWGGTIN